MIGMILIRALYLLKPGNWIDPVCLESLDEVGNKGNTNVDTGGEFLLSASVVWIGLFSYRVNAAIMALSLITRSRGGKIMTLHPQTFYVIPAETARVARAAFPKGNPYLRMYDELGVIYTDQQFAALFPQRGQPAVSPVRLALATIMQFAEGLSDRQAADAVRGRIDWKFLLCLELTDPGFDHTVLSEFRARLVAGKAEELLLDTLLSHFRERGLLKARSKQRTDSTHVVAAVRALNRLERVGETLRHALNVLATATPDWLQSWIPRAWFDQYGPRMENYRFPKTDSEREALAAQIGADGRTVLMQIDASRDMAWLNNLPAITTLRQVWADHFTDPPEPPRWRTVKDLPATAEQIVSPYDTEARWSMKRDVTWAGYKVHLTETCDAAQPRLITHVETTVATTPDDQAVPAIHHALARKALLPRTHLVDAGYTDADLLLQSTKIYGIDLVGPLAADPSWQAREKTGFDHAAFQVDWDAQSVTCPQGATSVQWHPKPDVSGVPAIEVRFARSACLPCASRSRCTKAATAPRSVRIRTQERYRVMQEARKHQQTPAFKAEYSQRAGVESTMAQGIRRSDLQQARYVGLAKVTLQHILTAVALNVVRVSAWWAGTPLAKTRVSPLQALKPAMD